METISKSIRKTNKVIIVEECMKTGGIGAELIALITEECFDDLDAPIERVSQACSPVPYADSLEQAVLPTKEQVIEAVKRVAYID